jgi:CheY-like chemotaxis protein
LRLTVFVPAELKAFRPVKSHLRKVLLIDDDPVQLRIREAVLRGAGFEVCNATNAKSALDLLRSHSAEIATIITDHMMPEVSGAEFVRLLRGINATVPVIVVSGLAEASNEYEGLDVTFRQKPCPPPELISLVQNFFDKAA